MSRSRKKTTPNNARRSRVDVYMLHGVAHRKRRQDEQRREGFSLSSAPGGATTAPSERDDKNIWHTTIISTRKGVDEQNLNVVAQENVTMTNNGKATFRLPTVRFRRKNKTLLKQPDKEDTVFLKEREIIDVWQMDKDGKTTYTWEKGRRK